MRLLASAAAAALLCLTLPLAAQTPTGAQRALTDKGEVVILEADGRWRYEKAQAAVAPSLELNPTAFTKTEAQNFQIKSTRNQAALWIDPAKWAFKRGKDEDAQEYRFQLKGGDAYGMLIAEGTDIPVETLLEVAVENARAVAPDVRVLEREYRFVNGHKMARMKMSGSTKGIAFVYLGYYLSTPAGAIQLVGYTSQALMPRFEPALQELLNGLTLQR